MSEYEVMMFILAYGTFAIKLVEFTLKFAIIMQQKDR